MTHVSYTEKSWVNWPRRFVCDGCGTALNTRKDNRESEPVVFSHKVEQCLSQLLERIRDLERQHD